MRSTLARHAVNTVTDNAYRFRREVEAVGDLTRNWSGRLHGGLHAPGTFAAAMSKVDDISKVTIRDARTAIRHLETSGLRNDTVDAGLLEEGIDNIRTIHRRLKQAVVVTDAGAGRGAKELVQFRSERVDENFGTLLWERWDYPDIYGRLRN